MADRLGISTLRTRPALFIGGQPFTVVAIIDDVERKADLLLSIVMPRSTAQEIWGEPAPGGAKMLTATEPGAGIGLVTGLAAGLYPAWRASRIEPAEALRR